MCYNINNETQQGFQKYINIKLGAVLIQLDIDIFSKGLDGVSAAIEAFKNDPANKIETDIEINADDKTLEDLQKAYDDISKSTSSYTSNQKSLV